MIRTQVQRDGDRLSFLNKLKDGPKNYTGSDRHMDQAKQWCRRQGYVVFKKGYWSLTDAGRAFLKADAEI